MPTYWERLAKTSRDDIAYWKNLVEILEPEFLQLETENETMEAKMKKLTDERDRLTNAYKNSTPSFMPFQQKHVLTIQYNNNIAENKKQIDAQLFLMKKVKDKFIPLQASMLRYKESIENCEKALLAANEWLQLEDTYMRNKGKIYIAGPAKFYG